MSYHHPFHKPSLSTRPKPSADTLRPSNTFPGGSGARTDKTVRSHNNDDDDYYDHNHAYAVHPEGTRSTPALLFPGFSSSSEEEYDGEDGGGRSGSGRVSGGGGGGGRDLTAAQVGTATAIRIPFLDEDEVSRLHPPAREVHHRRRGHQRNRQHQISSSNSSPSRACWASTSAAGATSISTSSRGAGAEDDERGGDGGRGSGGGNNELFDVDTAVRVSMISLGLGRLENANDHHHPGPLCSNPPQEDSIAATSSSSPLATDAEGMMMMMMMQQQQQQFDEVSLGTRRSRPLSQVYDLNLGLATSPCPSPSPRQQSLSAADARDDRRATSSSSSVPIPRSPASLAPPSIVVNANNSNNNNNDNSRDEEDASDLAHLQTTLAALLAANTALMTLKAAHEQTIAYHEGTILAHKDSIAELSRQLRERDEAGPAAAAAATTEAAGLGEENAALREERWNLLGRVAELEQTTARMEALLRLGGQMEVGGAGAGGAGKVVREKDEDDDWPLRRGGSRRSSASASGSTLQCFSSPAVQSSPWTGNGAVGSPDTLPSSLPSPDSCRRNSMQGFYAASPTPRDGRSAYSAIHRRQKIPPQALGAEDGVVYPVEQTKLEKAQLALQERNVRLQANAEQDALIQGLASISTSPPSMSVPLPVPELPVLAYNKSGAVWLDRITTIFRYLGLLDFLRGEDQRPDPSSSPSSAAAADWAARRLRAAILLKQAVDDAILEDVLYLNRRRDNHGASASGNSPPRPPPATEDPRRLLATILTLNRTVPSSPTDLSWIDRIDRSDFDGADGFEGFASLVLCVDRRLSLLYGTSVDHYEVLLPRIQECMLRLFPGLEGMALFGDPESVIPRKRWQLTVWMAKVVKKRRIGDY